MRLEKNVFHLVGMRSENFEDVAGLVAEELTLTDGSLKLYIEVLGLPASCGLSHQRHQNERGKPSPLFAFYLQTQLTKI